MSITIEIHDDGTVEIGKNRTDIKVEPCTDEKFKTEMSQRHVGGKIFYHCGSSVCVYHSGRRYCG